MKVNLNGRKLFIRWKYDDVQVVISGRPLTKEEFVYSVPKRPELGGRIETIPVMTTRTTCIVTDPETKEDIASVSVKLWHRDIFNRFKARKWSFKKFVEVFYPIRKPINEYVDNELIRHVSGDTEETVFRQKMLREELWNMFNTEFPEKPDAIVTAAVKTAVKKALADAASSELGHAVPL